MQSAPIRYVALGDSLTAGHGVRLAESWPYRLTQELKKEGLNMELVRNLAYSGNTSLQVLQEQVPQLPGLNPSFLSLLIGSNDMARGVDLASFEANFVEILNRVQKALPNPTQVLVLNLPDFASTPAALKYSGHLHLAPYMQQFNHVVEREAKIRHLALVDFFQITRELGPEKSLYSWDGLHPSAKGYEVLEKFIRPVALQLLKDTNSSAENAA